MTKTLTGYDVLVYVKVYHNKDILNNIIFALKCITVRFTLNDS